MQSKVRLSVHPHQAHFPPSARRSASRLEAFHFFLLLTEAMIQKRPPPTTTGPPNPPPAPANPVLYKQSQKFSTHYLRAVVKKLHTKHTHRANSQRGHQPATENGPKPTEKKGLFLYWRVQSGLSTNDIYVAFLENPTARQAVNSYHFVNIPPTVMHQWFNLLGAPDTGTVPSDPEWLFDYQRNTIMLDYYNRQLKRLHAWSPYVGRFVFANLPAFFGYSIS
jgi:hypothetical protein